MSIALDVNAFLDKDAEFLHSVECRHEPTNAMEKNQMETTSIFAEIEHLLIFNKVKFVFKYK